MSLVGSLEDLGLADILQIVSLAQKSGRLLLRSGGESGRILLRAGLVCGSAVKGESDDLRSLLVDGGHIPAEQFTEASRLAEDDALSLVAAVLHVSDLEPDALEALRRDRAERSVMRMFAWSAGEFSFDVRDGIDPEDHDLELEQGINTQYLAMEASRLDDEGVDLVAYLADSRGSARSAEEASDDEPEFLIASEDECSEVDAGMGSPVDALALASARGVEQESESESESELQANSLEAVSEAPSDLTSPDSSEVGATSPDDVATPMSASTRSDVDPVGSEIEPESEPGPEFATAPEPESDTDDLVSQAATVIESTSVDEDGPNDSPSPALATAVIAPPIVAMDPDLSGLEWLKHAVDDSERRVHLFQSADPGVARVRQYLARGQRPVVLISPRIQGTVDDADVDRIVARLRGLVSTLPIVELLCEGREAPGSIEGVTGALRRPVAPGHDPDGWSYYEAQAARLREELERISSAPQAAAKPDPATLALQRLKALSQRLQNPAQEDVLSLVLDFAFESFSRVGVFMLRDEQAVGMASRGFASGGGKEALHGIRWNCEELPALFRGALSSRNGVFGNLQDPGNEALAELAGLEQAPAYVGPIESGGCVAALLYADSDPTGEMADTTMLDIVLHEAGLALDRALLERTLNPAGESD